MITYINSIKDTRTSLCSEKIWETLVNGSPTKQYIEMYRQTGDISWKQKLPAVNFHGYDPGIIPDKTTGVAAKQYGSRKQEDLVPTGLFMLDIDHVEDPRELAKKLLKTPLDSPLKGDLSQIDYMANNSAANKISPLEGELEGVKDSVALVHITPSGKGLRIVMRGRPSSTIKDDQAWLAGLLGVQHDECTKDLSRWSFVPMASDIIYCNPDILFSPAQEPQDPTQTPQDPTQTCTYSDVLNIGLPYSGGGLNYNRLQGETTLFGDAAGNGSKSPLRGDSGGSLFPLTFRGIPYTAIVDRLIQARGGYPEVGERHAKIIKLANDLKTITDKNVDWMMEIIPDFDKPRSEKREAITWAVNHITADKSPTLKNVISDLLTEAKGDEADLTFLDEEEEKWKKEQLSSMPQIPSKLPKLVSLLTSKVMDFQKPAVAQMCFPALAAHVADSIFINNENKKFELALMGVLVGQQSVGKGCIDAPIECIIESILAEDEQAREALREWADSQQNKKANEKGSQRPEMPIRVLNTDTTPAALLANLFNAERNGKIKNLCCFTKSEEIEEMYDMSPTSGRSKVAQLIKKTYDRGRIGSERFTSAAANYTTVLRWNWITACTPDKAKMFFKRVLTDGTLSRIDFATILAPEEDIDFIYGDYDEQFENALEPYIDKLRSFRCERDAKGRLKPFRLLKLQELERDMDKYIKEYSKEMPDDTWKNYAWRTKLNALKKILVLYIANGCVWEDEFEDFLWWTFHYGMWVKMNLFYEKAREAFTEENIIASVSIKSPLELVGEEFTRAEFTAVCKSGGFKSAPAQMLHDYRRRKKIKDIEKDRYKKI